MPGRFFKVEKGNLLLDFSLKIPVFLLINAGIFQICFIHNSKVAVN